MSKEKVDFLIVGAGFSGLVVGQNLAEAGWKCVVVDRRPHLGGNAYDSVDEAGVLIHRYGPHYFRTNSQRIIDYLSRFTEWHPVEYQVQSFTDGRYWSFPINLNTFEQFIGRASTTEEFEAWLEKNRLPIENPKNSEEAILAAIGREWYEKFFEGYTLKQWKRHPRELDASLCRRVPIRTNRDERYLREEFQALPKDGYTKMFERMVEASPNLEIHFNTDFEEAKGRWEAQHLIYSGAIDEYYGYCHGELPYRSLEFEAENFTAEQLRQREAISGKVGFWQPALQVNYPSQEIPYTRIVEIKHATGQEIDSSTIVREFPADWSRGKEPYYPVPAPDAQKVYKKYADLAKREERVSFIGRLGTYQYYNMDQVTGMALMTAKKLNQKYRKK